ncbi:MAG TPA: Xaa-Pro peptidase family protein [Solirubrobacteraceae bacterium]|jgi:Xaa-Pro aminopeptidase|nr:Xaa-Pro peptidase family protein [Solirubrobacteraceae bacterium]
MVAPPFDCARLDALMEAADIEWLLATSRANVRYLLGGYEYLFQVGFDEIGISRYLPVVAYRRGQIEDAYYVAAPHELTQLELTPIWIAQRVRAESSVEAAIEAAAAPIAGTSGRVGVELDFLPASAWLGLAEGLPDAELVDAAVILEQLRAVKSPCELDRIRAASVGIVDAMLATIGAAEEGMSKASMAAIFEDEVRRRGLRFDYVWIAAGANLVRTPIGGHWRVGEPLSLDSGGRLDGYIGDLCRMATIGPPTPDLEGRLQEVTRVQETVRQAVMPGVPGRAVVDAALAALSTCSHRRFMRTLVHGLGLVSHEAPRLMKSGIPYLPTHADDLLEAGMVLSAETEIADPNVGLVKLEDTIIVTPHGCEVVADYGRGWNQAGTQSTKTTP